MSDEAAEMAVLRVLTNGEPITHEVLDALRAVGWGPLSTPPADDVREALDLDDLEAKARAQIVAIDQMDEVGRGVGGMTRPNLAAYMAWQDASDGYDHADTVLALIERLRSSEVRLRGTVTDAEVEAALEGFVGGPFDFPDSRRHWEPKMRAALEAAREARS